MKMTMNKIADKLRRQNRGQYRLLGLCIFLSMLLVTSFTLMFFSQSIQEFLPPGGDTRKLMWLMLGVVSIGCLIFTLYGSGLFFRSKRQGVRSDAGAWNGEKGTCAPACERTGGGGRNVHDCWNDAGSTGVLPDLEVLSASGGQYGADTVPPGAAGILAGLCFAAVLSLGILVLGVRFIRRTDIMDILNAGRKTEMVRVIRPYTGKLGMALVAAGLFLAMAVPQMTVRLFRQGMPGIWNVTYLIAAAGLYLLMLSAVARSGKGRHPETYYKHIISTNLMRFSARQTTRNLCVIAMLVFVMVLSAFWGVMYYFSVTEGGSEALYDYSIHYPAEEEQIGGEDVRRLAREYGVEITAYEELETLELVIRYTGRDMDDSGRYFDVEYEKLASFLPESDFTRISGIPMDLGEGEYRSVTSTGYLENIWVSADCLNAVEHPVTGKRMVPRFRGTVEFDNLAMTSDPFAFVISDEDYAWFAEGLSEKQKKEHMFFCVKDDMETYDFADAWRREYIAHATERSSHYRLYDAHEEALSWRPEMSTVMPERSICPRTTRSFPETGSTRPFPKC